MLKMLVVGLQTMCLCVAVGFFATGIMENNAGSIVGGWCVGSPANPPTNPMCHGSSSSLCPGITGCPLRFSECHGGAGGGGLCTNTAMRCNTDDRCNETQACACSVNAE